MKDDHELAGAQSAVVLRLARLNVDESVDNAGLAVLHEARRLGTIRPSLSAQMRLDLSTISLHLRSLKRQGLVQRSADPDDARAQRIGITACGDDVLNRVLDSRAATIRGAIAHWAEGDRSALRQLLCRLADDLSNEDGVFVTEAVCELVRPRGAADAALRTENKDESFEPTDRTLLGPKR